jgi:hypothetical protein
MIGGTVSGAGNVISGFGVGIDISGFNAVGNAIEGNLIGTDRNGNRLPKSIDIGVYINDVESNTVGGTTAEATNVIAGYTSYGVFIYGTLATKNVVQGNRIGMGAPSHSGQLAGIAIEDASDNTLGGSIASAGNTITGNADAGIYIFGRKNSASGNVSSQNHLEHNGYGVLLYNAANNGGYATLLQNNHFKRNGIANVREFTGSVPSSKVLSHTARSKGNKTSQPAAIHRTRVHPLRTRWTPIMRRSCRPIERTAKPASRSGPRSRRTSRRWRGSADERTRMPSRTARWHT